MQTNISKIWTKQFGSSDEDFAYAMTLGVGGSIYIAGFTRSNKL